jgi:hypothetical protein
VTRLMAAVALTTLVVGAAAWAQGPAAPPASCDQQLAISQATVEVLRMQRQQLEQELAGVVAALRLRQQQQPAEATPTKPAKDTQKP